jgi:hypothetical protein
MTGSEIADARMSAQGPTLLSHAAPVVLL